MISVICVNSVIGLIRVRLSKGGSRGTAMVVVTIGVGVGAYGNGYSYGYGYGDGWVSYNPYLT